MRKMLVFNNKTNRYTVVDAPASLSQNVSLEAIDYSTSTMYDASLLTEIIEGLGAPIFGIYDLAILSGFKESLIKFESGKVNESYVKDYVNKNRSSLERALRNIDQMLDFANFRNFLKRAPLINIVAKFVGDGTLQQTRDLLAQWL